jgi:hypothetical protein
MPKQPTSSSKPDSFGGSRLESILAFSAIGVIATSIICMFVTLVISASNQNSQPAILAQIPLFGMPLGALLIIALVVVSVIRRRRENQK